MSDSGKPVATARFIRWAVTFEGSIVLVAAVAGSLTGYPPWVHLPPDGKTAALDIAVGLAGCVPLLIGLVAMVRWPIRLWGDLVQFVEHQVVPMFRGATVPQFALIATLAGIGEEALFRGVLLDLFSGWWGLAVAIAATSVLFGLVHYLTMSYAVLAAGIGLYMAVLLRLQQGSLLAPIVTHAVYDFVALVYLTGRTPAAGSESAE